MEDTIKEREIQISGGEDCRYRVWDTYGRQLFSSGQHD